MDADFRPRTLMRRAYWLSLLHIAVGTGLGALAGWLLNIRSGLGVMLVPSCVVLIAAGLSAVWSIRIGTRAAAELERRGFACCTRCEHDLRGITAGAVCPECEMPTTGDRRRIWKLYVPRIRVGPPPETAGPTTPVFPPLPAGFPVGFEPVREMSRMRWMAAPLLLAAMIAIPLSMALAFASMRFPAARVWLAILSVVIALGVWAFHESSRRRARVRELVMVADFAFCPECGACQAGLPREDGCPRCGAVTRDRHRETRWREILGLGR